MNPSGRISLYIKDMDDYETDFYFNNKKERHSTLIKKAMSLYYRLETGDFDEEIQRLITKHEEETGKKVNIKISVADVKVNLKKEERTYETEKIDEKIMLNESGTVKTTIEADKNLVEIMPVKNVVIKQVAAEITEPKPGGMSDVEEMLKKSLLKSMGVIN